MKVRSRSTRIIHKQWDWVAVMAFNKFTTLEEFENCIWRNEISSDQILDQMAAMTFPEEVRC